MKLTVINLAHRTDRWAHITEEFKGYPIVRFDAVRHERGWIGCLKSHGILLNLLTKTDDSGIYPVLEDDCTILCSREEFDTRWAKYQRFLKQHEGEWDFFTMGGTYVQPLRIVCRDPFVIECGWSVATHFIVHSKQSAQTMIDYAARDDWDTACDNHLSRSHRGHIWIAYPMMCGWIKSPSDISDEYIDKCNAAFVETIKDLEKFVEEAL